MISGKYTGLRAIEEDDLPQLLLWRNNPKLRKYFREFKELSVANQKQWYSERVIKDPNTHMFSIVNLADNHLIGACGLCYIDWKNRNADFSLYIGKDGQYIDAKFSADAGKILLSFGFRELNLHRIYAEIFEFDNAKRRLLKKLKFIYEGTHRDTVWCNGKWYASEYYSILATEYGGS